VGGGGGGGSEINALGKKCLTPSVRGGVRKKVLNKEKGSRGKGEGKGKNVQEIGIGKKKKNEVAVMKGGMAAPLQEKGLPGSWKRKKGMADKGVQAVGGLRPSWGRMDENDKPRGKKSGGSRGAIKRLSTGSQGPCVKNRKKTQKRTKEGKRPCGQKQMCEKKTIKD